MSQQTSSATPPPLSSLTFRQLQMCKHFSAVHPLPAPLSVDSPVPFHVVTDTLHWFMQIACMENHGKIMGKIVNCAKCWASEVKLLCEWHACVALATITLCSRSHSVSLALFFTLAPSRLTRSNYANFNAKVNATCCMFALLNWCTLKRTSLPISPFSLPHFLSYTLSLSIIGFLTTFYFDFHAQLGCSQSAF